MVPVLEKLWRESHLLWVAVDVLSVLGDMGVCIYQNSFSCTLMVCAFRCKFYLKRCRKWKCSGRTVPGKAFVAVWKQARGW